MDKALLIVVQAEFAGTSATTSSLSASASAI